MTRITPEQRQVAANHERLASNFDSFPAQQLRLRTQIAQQRDGRLVLVRPTRSACAQLTAIDHDVSRAKLDICIVTEQQRAVNDKHIQWWRRHINDDRHGLGNPDRVAGHGHVTCPFLVKKRLRWVLRVDQIQWVRNVRRVVLPRGHIGPVALEGLLATQIHKWRRRPAATAWARLHPHAL